MAILYGITDRLPHPIALENILPPIVLKLLLRLMVSDPVARMSLLPLQPIPMAHSPTMSRHIKLDLNHRLSVSMMTRILLLCSLHSISNDHHPEFIELLLLLLYLPWRDYHYLNHLHPIMERAYRKWAIMRPVTDHFLDEDQSLLQKLLPSLHPQNLLMECRIENQPSYLVDHTPLSIPGGVRVPKEEGDCRRYQSMVMADQVDMDLGNPIRHRERNISYIISILTPLPLLLIHHIKHRSSRHYRHIKWKVGCRFRIDLLPMARLNNLQPNSRVQVKVVYLISDMTR
jgi:hypothetical protein